MYQQISSILQDFILDFKRFRTWQWFVAMVIGFMIRGSHNGVTSMISSLRLKPKLYPSAIHFFRSNGYETDDLYTKWIQTAKKECELQRIGGRILLIGDHIKKSKEGRRMPDIELLHQSSENSGKNKYIEGHNYGHVSAVITNGKISRSLPLITELQKSPPKDKKTKKPIGDTVVVQIAKLVKKTAVAIDEPVLAAVDGYFCNGPSFKAIEEAQTKNGEQLIWMVTRGRRNTVGFKTPEPPNVKKPGRPKVYGEKVVLKDIFSNTSEFKQATMMIYGKKTKVKYLCLDLLWRPLKKMVRFVLVESDLGKMILLSNSLTLDPEDCIAAYVLRYKIEPSFDEQKNDIGSFSYRFWSKSQPKRTKWQKNNDKPDDLDNKNVVLAKKATEAFVCVATIASGILSALAFSHSNEIWKRYPGWLRTIRSNIPTIATVKDTLAQDFHSVLKHHSTYLVGFNFLGQWIRKEDFVYEVLDELEEAS